MVLQKLLRAGEGKTLRRLKAIADAVNGIEDDITALSDAELRAETDVFKKRLADGETLDDILVEAFAVGREAARRTLGQRHFDVQVMGAAALHLGNIAEMRTGEGKTLTSTLAAYLNALDARDLDGNVVDGKGVHIVTVNDYLAKRDAEWMGRVHRFLGLTVGVILANERPDVRRPSYACDITYGTNNEFGFDYLRDNMAWNRADLVQRGHNFAIVDEADSILIDEARTPLIISGPAEQSARWYQEFARLAPMLERDVHYEVDERKRTVGVTEEGVALVEDQLGIDNLYEAVNSPLISYLNNALKAKELFKKDKDYIVSGGKVVIVDEFTGRVLSGRRYNEGMHQAIEAKEKVQIKNENQTLATITLQNYFRLYDKLSGMTGTASTEAAEFSQTYDLGVVEIPTNKPPRRLDEPDVVYKTEPAKFEAVVEDIAEKHEAGQPVLVGTVSVEKSEYLSALLSKRGIPHEVLNAKQHAREATIVAQAGRKGAVTVATNMAGRGTDIMLGGNPEFIAAAELASRGFSPVDTPQEYEQAWPEALERAQRSVEAEHEEVVEAGGLYVLGTERHESRRIDNQLRGRSGRQGDPGRSKFYLSLQDDLMRIFGSDRMDGMLTKLGLEQDEAIIHPWINKAIEKAQQKVEARNFDIRKNILKYDNVMNDQRKVVFEQRKEFMGQESVRETIAEMRHGTVDDVVLRHIPPDAYPEQWDLEGMKQEVVNFLNLDLPVDEWAKEEGIADEEMRERLRQAADEAYAARIEKNSAEVMGYIEKQVLLQTLDHLWREHLVTLDHLRQVIGWRGYAQRDPLNEYKSEAFELFNSMIGHLRQQVTAQLMRIEVVFQQPEPELPPMFAQHLDPSTGENEFDTGGSVGLGSPPYGGVGLLEREPMVAAAERDPSDPATWGKVGRNEACPCGSGKKYKHCHGRFA